ncbi:nuclease-related domain-containing protein [Terrilactibacillus laevilacticus]|uniref:Nuclease-related domain-containing protein n=1 Tax=Terrilactibacillus laevilacticus TaxID=1380157 RepID=A0ABW5PKJ3_9BACI|nr:nuclease-related domain-containing protein [Terrilactibacillus laevilacticus]
MVFILIIMLISLVVICFYLLRKQKKIQNEAYHLIEQSKKEVALSLQKERNRLEQESEKTMQGLLEDHSMTVVGIQENYEKKLSKQKDYINFLQRSLKCPKDAATYRVLKDIKKLCLNEQLIQEEDMLIIGNIFLPYYTINGENKIKQLSHVLLLPTGIYLIESKYWEGRVYHGLTRELSHPLDFLFDIFHEEELKDGEHTFILTRKKGSDVSGEFKNTLNIELQMNIGRELCDLAKELERSLFDLDSSQVVPILYFDSPKDDHRIRNYSERDLPQVCIGPKDLNLFIRKELQSQEWLLSAAELKEVKQRLENLYYFA